MVVNNRENDTGRVSPVSVMESLGREQELLTVKVGVVKPPPFQTVTCLAVASFGPNYQVSRVSTVKVCTVSPPIPVKVEAGQSVNPQVATITKVRMQAASVTYSPERYVVGALPKSSGPQIARIIESNGPKAPDVGSRSSGLTLTKLKPVF